MQSQLVFPFGQGRAEGLKPEFGLGARVGEDDAGLVLL